MFYNREECLLSRSLRSREREGGGLVGMNGIKGGRLRERFFRKREQTNGEVGCRKVGTRAEKRGWGRG